MLDWKEGDYYSKDRVERTIRNLLSLGVFTSVTIDTTDFRDSIIDYAILTNYRNQQEFYLEPGANQTQNYFYNIFLNLIYSNKNILGGAQGFSAATSILNRDVEDFLKTKNRGFFNYLDDFVDEVSLNLSYSDPYIFKVNDAFLGLSSNPVLSIRRIDNFFNLNTILLPINFPIKFKTNLDLKSFAFFINIERQQPSGFDEFVNSKNDEADFDRVFQSLILYNDLNNYFKQSGNYVSSVSLGARAIRDKRNNPFMPTYGHLINGEVEYAFAGLTKYFRLLATWTTYNSLSKYEVLGTKLKFGGFYFLEEGNRYASLDKQFFAGGANSVRGWDSRKLRYTNAKLNDVDANSRRLLENFVGNAMIFETSFEYRLKFKEPDINLGALNEHISSMGLTMFLDIGNSYGWLLGGNDFNFTDIFTKLAYSAGAGLTYETPVGPLRLDLAMPIYGPIGYKYEGIWNTKDLMSNLNWHVGLGYSF